MKEIGRNEKCPCMSGKKYKNCCDKTKKWEFFKNHGLSFYDESYYLKNLLEQDLCFKSLYFSDRVRIKKPILFFQSNINIQAAMSYGTIENESYCITSKYSQLPLSESVHVAHELEHLLLHSEGHKAVSFKDENLNQSIRTHKMLNDMIYDPMVNKKLINYGYDLISYLKNSDKTQMNLPKIGENIFLVKTLYVKRFLDYKNIDPNINKNEIDFIKWVQKDYPEVIEDAENILKIIDMYGTSSTEQTENSLINIIKYLKLDDKLKVKLI